MEKRAGESFLSPIMYSYSDMVSHNENKGPLEADDVDFAKMMRVFELRGRFAEYRYGPC